MKITKKQLTTIIKEERAKVLKEQRKAPDARWWELAFGNVIEDEVGYGEVDPETNRNILAALQNMVRNIKDELRGDVR